MDAALNLKTPFFQSFDASSISSLMQRLAKLSETERRRHPDFLGEGLHFQTFGLAAKPLPLVVKLAKSSFLEQGFTKVKQWRQAIQHLKTVEATNLIPPMEVIENDGVIGLVMPKGQHLAKNQTLALPLEAKLFEMAQALRQAGLVLDDYPQLLHHDGIPFIRDWSDLQMIRR